MSPLGQLTLARLRIFFREPGAVFWTFGFPLVLSLTLGIAFRNQPPEPVAIAVAAGCPSALLALSKNPAFVVIASPDDPAALRAVTTGKAGLAVVSGCAYRFDPTRPASRLARALVIDALERAAGRRDLLPVREEPVTEPGSRYIDFLVPGLIGMNIMSSGMWGIGYVIVDMRTRKLLKRLMATPVSRAQFLWSFVLMRMLFLVLELPVLLGFAALAFKVQIAGSLGLLVGLSFLGAFAFSGIGLLVAARAENTQTVSGLINLIMMPMFIGSGVFFSTSRFPAFLQPVLAALPLTALNDSLRAVMIDGKGLAGVAGPAALLAAIAVVSFGAALRLFRWS